MRYTFNMTYKVVNSTVEMAQELEAIQQASFPTLSPDELITADHYKRHVEVFPEGQFAAIKISGDEAGKVVACSTDFRIDMDFEHYEHRYIDIVDGNWLGNHNPNGQWLYGADIGVHPDHRGQGISKLMYAARHDLAKRLNLKGHVAGGMLIGYGEYKASLSVEDYVAKVVAGEIFDATLSVQLRRGFQVRGIIQNYVEDASCDNKAALIVWENIES